MKIRLDIDLLRTLVAFADTGSFKGASQLVSRTQPTISMQMKRLEEIIDQPLFVHRGRHIVFNDKGMRLALQARHLLALHDKIAAEWQQLDVGGKVRLGIPDDYVRLVLPHILETFSTKYEKVSLEVMTNTSPILTEQLNSGALDLTILATTTPKSDDVVLRREQIVWATSPNHPVHLQSPLPLAVFSDESPVAQATLAAMQRFSPEVNEPMQFRLNVISDSWAVLAAVATFGYAVTTMARNVVPDGLRILTEEDGFPDLGHVTLVMRRTPDSQSLATSHMAEEILDFFRSTVAVRATPQV